ncbi:MAG: GNAT family N-acetyltransferase [Deltaproteobacteria bacterium]|nr:GNAT family N-acetyltransferase [Deltaproteobacteria bacterium]
MDPIIRPAREADSELIAWVLQAAARSHLEVGIWDLAFPGPDEQRLAILAKLATTEQLHFAHYSRFLVAEADGQPAAALSAYEASEFGGEKLSKGVAEVVIGLGWSGEEITAMMDRIQPYSLLGYPNPDGLWIIEWVATRSEFRGRGLMNLLIVAILEQGRAAGFECSQIGHLLGNFPAQRTYEAAGFKRVDEYTHAAFEQAFGSAGIARLQRDI